MGSAGEFPYSFELLDKKVHDRSSFSCGIESLDRYLKIQSGQDYRRDIAVSYVFTEKGDPKVLGYYTLSAFSVDIGEFPNELSRKLPQHESIPATLIGRLAVDQSCQGLGHGEMILMDALKRSLQAASKVASHAVVVDTINEEAKRFYLHFDFRTFPNRQDRLFLPMKEVAQLFV